MKLPILILCLVCLCVSADTNFPIITYSNGKAHTNEYLVFKGTNSYFGIKDDDGLTNASLVWKNMMNNRNTYSTNCVVYAWDKTNFIIPDSYKGTI